MIPIIDMHCDTISGILRAKNNGEEVSLRENDMSVDLKKLKEGGYLCQNFALFTHLDSVLKKGESPLAHAILLSDTMDKEMIANPDMICPVVTGTELEKNLADGILSGLKTIEEGAVYEGKVENLQLLYERGVRMSTLTWNYENCFGYPNSRDPEKMALGLKPFGREAVKRMNELGILVDTSHLSDGGFYDVAAISDKPFIASHSNARALSPHPRNLTDDMLRIIGEKHGVAGLNFYGAFLSDDGTGKASVVSDMVRHALYIVGKAGEDALAIGSDFDGFEGECQIRTPLEMPLLFESLKKAGLTERQIEKAIHLNARRVIESVI